MIANSKDSGNFGVVVSGGPAPGINSVISSVTIEAINKGYRVFGLREGFKKVCTVPDNGITEITIDQVTSIHATGGSYLGTARFNPLKSPAFENLRAALEQHKINKLVVIGGDGSAFVSYNLSKKLPGVKIAHVPKTIDNDLILPNQAPSFGFETARYVGTKILNTLITDAKTTNRWFIVTSMGRRAGFLALGLGLAAGATLTVIPEEFKDRKITPDELVQLLLTSIRTRASQGEPYGVAVLAEGLLECFEPDSHPMLRECPRDDLGRLKHAEIELGEVITPILRQTCRASGLELKFSTKNIGFELRCHEPISFDVEYTKFLGYGAVKFLLEGQTGFMVTRDFDEISFIPLQEMVGPDGLIMSRTVNLDSELYRVARSFMIR